MEDLELLQGTVAAVVYQNAENGYAVLRLSCGGQAVSVVGTIPLPVPGERLVITGRWANNANYGKQFEAEFLERLMPETTPEILSYLSSRTVKGIGPKLAARIVERFGAETLAVMERNLSDWRRSPALRPRRPGKLAGFSASRRECAGSLSF